MKPVFAFLFLLFTITLTVYGQTKQKADSLNRVCVPGKSVGAISAYTSEEDLIRIYGKKNVSRSKIYMGEGNFETGTLLYANSKNELQITWKDTLGFKNPDNIYIIKPNTSWKTNSNISIGTSLKELEKINGKAFTMLGFGWDYGGTVVDWKGGNLDLYHTNSASEEGFMVRLDGRQANTEYRKIIGDKEFSSSNNVLQKLNPKVYELILFFKE